MKRLRMVLLVTAVLLFAILVSVLLGKRNQITVVLFAGETAQNIQRTIYAYQIETGLLVPMSPWLVFQGKTVYPACKSPFSQLMHLDDNMENGDTSVYLSSITTGEKLSPPVVLNKFPRGVLLSPNGEFLFFENDDGSWILEIASGNITKLTWPEIFFIADWSTDSQHLTLQIVDVYDYRRSRTYVFWVKDLRHAVLTAGLRRFSWSDDGALAVEQEYETYFNRKAYLVDPVTLARKKLLLKEVGPVSWSPDGHILAFVVKTNKGNSVVSLNVDTNEKVSVPLAPEVTPDLIDTMNITWVTSSVLLVKRDLAVEVVNLKNKTAVVHLKHMAIFSSICVVSEGP